MVETNSVVDLFYLRATHPFPDHAGFFVAVAPMPVVPSLIVNYAWASRIW